MILFFDRNVGTIVPKTLKTLRLPTSVEYHDDIFPKNTPDDRWLAEVGQWGWTVIGHDQKFHTEANELSALKQYRIGCFYLWGNNAPRWAKMQCFARAYDRIVAAEANTAKPFVFRVTLTGHLRTVPIP